jgi:hypothetical protein
LLAYEDTFLPFKIAEWIMSNIFISYSHEDQSYVQELVAYLKNEGLSVWVDDNIDHGDRWWQTIVANIRKCEAMIVVMTPESEKTDWVEREYLFADDIKKPLFPLLLKGNCFPFFINRQYHNVRGESMPPKKFVASLRRLTLQKNEEERKQKEAEEERKRKEAEAKQKAEEERKRKEAEAKQKAEEERKRKEAEAKQKAEEEHKRKTATGYDKKKESGWVCRCGTHNPAELSNCANCHVYKGHVIASRWGDSKASLESKSEEMRTEEERKRKEAEAKQKAEEEHKRKTANGYVKKKESEWVCRCGTRNPIELSNCKNCHIYKSHVIERKNW